MLLESSTFGQQKQRRLRISILNAVDARSRWTATHTAGLACTLTAHSVIRPMEKAETLWTLVFSLILAWWVYADRGARGFQLPFEFEFFVFIAWPVAVPYYLYRRRGGPGLFLGIGVWGLYMAPYVISAFVYIARTVRGGS